MKRNHRKPLQRNTFLFITPSLLGVMVFYILPFFVILYYAVMSRAVSGSFVGLENFRALLHNEAFLLAAKNTAIVCLWAVPLAVALSLGLAVLLEKEIPAKSQLRTAFLSPMMVPVASVVLLWQVLFHQNGVINTFLTGWGIDAADFFHSGWSRVMVLLLYLWKNLGYNMILFTAALASVPRELLDMAALEGASPLRTFRSIKLYYLAPTILFVTVLSFISSMKIFREVYLLTGAYPHESLYLLQHFMNNTFQSMDYQKLSTAAILLALAVSLIIGVVFRLEKRMGKDVENL